MPDQARRGQGIGQGRADEAGVAARRAAADPAALEDRDLDPLPGEEPGARKADEAATNDDDLVPGVRAAAWAARARRAAAHRRPRPSRRTASASSAAG